MRSFKAADIRNSEAIFDERPSPSYTAYVTFGLRARYHLRSLNDPVFERPKVQIARCTESPMFLQSGFKQSKIPKAQYFSEVQCFDDPIFRQPNFPTIQNSGSRIFIQPVFLKL